MRKYITTALAGAIATLAAGTAWGEAKGAHVVLLTVTEECEYCSRHQQAFRAKAEEAGIELDVKITNFDAAEQASQVEQAIAQNPDAIVLWPADASAIVPSLRKIHMADIPLVVTNSAPDSKYSDFWDVFTGPNDVGNGLSAGEAMAMGLEAKGALSDGRVFVIEGVPGTPPQIQRSQGFEEAMKDNAPEVEIFAKQNGNWDQTRATEAAAALFTQSGGKVQGVYAQADNMMSGVIVAAQRVGMDPASLVLVGSNCSIEGVQAIEAGTQYATVLQSPVDDGSYAAEAVIRLLDGTLDTDAMYLPHRIITKDNLSECDAAIGR